MPVFKIEGKEIKIPTLKRALKETGAPENPIYDFQRASIQGKEEMYDYLIKKFQKESKRRN